MEFKNTTDQPVDYTGKVESGTNHVISANSRAELPSGWNTTARSDIGLTTDNGWIQGETFGPIKLAPGESFRVEFGVLEKDFISMMVSCQNGFYQNMVGADVVRGTSPAEYVLPQRWNDVYAPGTRCATPGKAGVYRKVTQARTSTMEVSATIAPKGETERYIATAYGLNYVRVQHWSVGETVGPYTLGAGQQGKLVRGFMMFVTDAQNVRCSATQVWVAEGKPYSATVTESRYSELRVDPAPVFG